MEDFPGVGVPGLQFFGRPGTFLGFFVPGLHFFGRPGTLGEGKMRRGRDSAAQAARARAGRPEGARP
jgi:hypothetical protein